MRFAAPWWLGVGALLACALLLLHVLRPRPKPVRVSSLLLWRLTFEELAATERRRRFLANLLLLLQLFALFGLAFALAAPVKREERLPLHLAILVDTSASMAVAGDDGATRLQEAAQRLEALLSSGNAERYTLLSSWGGAPLYDGGSKEALLAAVRSLPAPAGTSDWEASIDALRAALAGPLPATVLLVSDGALLGSSLQGIEALGPRVSRHALIVGEPEGNVGITAFRARPVGGDPFRHEALIRVANYSSLRESVRLVVTSHRPGRSPSVVMDERLEIPAQDSAELLVEHTFAPGESLSALLDARDAFPLDNEAHLTAALPQAIRLLLVGVDEHFLREGFSIFSQVRVEFAPELPPDGGSRHDLVVFVDRPVPNHFSGTAAQFAASPTAPGGPLQITTWNRAHPLSRFVEWESIALAQGAPLDVSPGERVLVDSSRGPLVTAAEGESLRLVRVGIPLYGSDFPFRVAFPVFLYNLLQWAKPDEVRLVADALPPGTPPEALRRLSPGERVSLARSGEEERELALLDRDALRGSLARPGIYTWRAGSESGRFAVSLLDPEESNLTRRLDADYVRLGIAPLESERELWSAASQFGADQVEQPIWRWFAAAALAALAAEGFVATRSRRIKAGGSSA